MQTNMFTCWVNTKGGVGKSTLAVHWAVWLLDRGATVAFLDCDKQRSSSHWIAEAEPKITVETATTPQEVALKGRALLQSHDFVVGDGPAGLDELSRTLLVLADFALFPISPSILDLRSVAQATEVLKYAHSVNAGKPQGRLILNRMRTRDTISREVQTAAPSLGLTVAKSTVRELQSFRDAAQQATVVTRMPGRGQEAAKDVRQLFEELVLGFYEEAPKAANS